jgi:hypothetical protein
MTDDYKMDLRPHRKPKYRPSDVNDYFIKE